MVTSVCYHTDNDHDPILCIFGSDRKKTKNGYLISKKDQNLRKGSYTGTFDTTMESPKLDNPLTSYFSPNFVDISAIEKA